MSCLTARLPARPPTVMPACLATCLPARPSARSLEPPGACYHTIKTRIKTPSVLLAYTCASTEMPDHTYHHPITNARTHKQAHTHAHIHTHTHTHIHTCTHTYTHAHMHTYTLVALPTCFPISSVQQAAGPAERTTDCKHSCPLASALPNGFPGSPSLASCYAMHSPCCSNLSRMSACTRYTSRQNIPRRRCPPSWPSRLVHAQDGTVTSTVGLLGLPAPLPYQPSAAAMSSRMNNTNPHPDDVHCWFLFSPPPWYTLPRSHAAHPTLPSCTCEDATDLLSPPNTHAHIVGP